MRRFALFALMAASAASGASYACSPPAPLPVVNGPNETLVPYYEPSYFAFVGKVVGHTKNERGVPALSVAVLDAWTGAQHIGEVVTIAVEQWKGCDIPKPMGKAFRPTRYPIGTRVRIVSRDRTMYSWDVQVGIHVIGIAP